MYHKVGGCLCCFIPYQREVIILQESECKGYIGKDSVIKKHVVKGKFTKELLPGHLVQSQTCLATDVSLNADPGVASLILARSHTFMEIDYEIISTVILLPSADSFKKGHCQLQAKVCARSTG